MKRVWDKTTKKWNIVPCLECAQNGAWVNRSKLIGYTGNYAETKTHKDGWGGVNAHLHFGVHKVHNEKDVAVDPYGWEGPPGTDPYTQFHPGVVDYPLWLPPPK